MCTCCFANMPGQRVLRRVEPDLVEWEQNGKTKAYSHTKSDGMLDIRWPERLHTYKMY